MTDLEAHDEPLQFAALRQENEPCAYRIGRRLDLHVLSVDLDHTSIGPIRAKDGPCHLRAPTAHQPRQPDDLSGPNVERHILDEVCPREALD